MAVTHLIHRLDDRAPQLRFWSASSLAKLGEKRARQPRRMLRSDRTIVSELGWTVGHEAADALARIDRRWVEHDCRHESRREATPPDP